MKHPKIDPHMRTPIYKVHLLHFATAHLNKKLLLEIVETGIPLHSAGKTALGHTLLHVACLPPTQLHLQVFAPKIFESIHDLGQPIPDQTQLAFKYSHHRPMPQLTQSLAPNVDGPGSTQPSDGSEHPFFGLPRSERNHLHSDEWAFCEGDGHIWEAGPADHILRQTELVKYLLESGTQALAAGHPRQQRAALSCELSHCEH